MAWGDGKRVGGMNRDRMWEAREWEQVSEGNGTVTEQDWNLKKEKRDIGRASMCVGGVVLPSGTYFPLRLQEIYSPYSRFLSCYTVPSHARSSSVTCSCGYLSKDPE